MAASQGVHYKRIQELKTGMNEFKTSWLNFNKPLVQVPMYPGQPIKPTVLVVADEIFTMPDKNLSYAARLSVPNTLKESSMVQVGQRNTSSNGRCYSENKSNQRGDFLSSICGLSTNKTDNMMGQIKKSEMMRQ